MSLKISSYSLILISLLAINIALAAPASANPERWKLEGWKTDFSRKSVKFSEILPGGPAKDGIPSIDDPIFESPKDNKTLSDIEPVIQLVMGGEARAYPLRILTWHEIVNDVIAGIPVAVTYCPLCNASIVFDRRVDGEVLEFGTTGKLRNSDLVMYDRGSESWWQQFTGEAIAGIHTGKELTMLPVRVVSFTEFARNYPEGKVLVPNPLSRSRYGQNPYVNYDSRNAPYTLYTGSLPTDINPMARLVVIRDKGKPRAITMAKLRMEGAAKLGDVDLVWTKGVASALDNIQIAKGRDVGAVTATRLGNGKRQDVVHDITFAFVYHAFHPDGELVQ